MTPRTTGSGPRRGQKRLRAVPTDRSNFVRYLKFARLKLGMTQAEAAKEVGITQGAYCNIERGQKKPHPRLYPVFAEVLQVPVNDLVSRIHKLDPDQR